jgi:hypothetical protein
MIKKIKTMYKKFIAVATAVSGLGALGTVGAVEQTGVDGLGALGTVRAKKGEIIVTSDGIDFDHMNNTEIMNIIVSNFNKAHAECERLDAIIQEQADLADIISKHGELSPVEIKKMIEFSAQHILRTLRLLDTMNIMIDFYFRNESTSIDHFGPMKQYIQKKIELMSYDNAKVVAYLGSKNAVKEHFSKIEKKSEDDKKHFLKIKEKPIYDRESILGSNEQINAFSELLKKECSNDEKLSQAIAGWSTLQDKNNPAIITITKTLTDCFHTRKGLKAMFGIVLASVQRQPRPESDLIGVQPQNLGADNAERVKIVEKYFREPQEHI